MEPPHIQAKTALKRFLKQTKNRACASIVFQLLTNQYTTGELAEIRRKISEDTSKIREGIEFLKNKILKDREFSASIVPTIVSSDRARNFLFANEKEPTEEEIYYWLYMILSGLYSGTYVLNLINVDEKAKDNFRSILISNRVMFSDKRGVDRKMLAKVCRGPIPSGEHVFAFAFLNYFMYWQKKQMKTEFRKREWGDMLDEFGLPRSLVENWRITDETTLVIFDLPREKRKMYYIPRMKDFIQKWYSNFFLDPKMEYPPLGMFVSSLYTREYRDISSSLLNKFLYYLLQGSVNGELLEKLTSLKTEYVLSAKRQIGIVHAKNFFSKISYS